MEDWSEAVFVEVWMEMGVGWKIRVRGVSVGTLDEHGFWWKFEWRWCFGGSLDGYEV